MLRLLTPRFPDLKAALEDVPDTGAQRVETPDGLGQITLEWRDGVTRLHLDDQPGGGDAAVSGALMA